MCWVFLDSTGSDRVEPATKAGCIEECNIVCTTIYDSLVSRRVKRHVNGRYSNVDFSVGSHRLHGPAGMNNHRQSKRDTATSDVVKNVRIDVNNGPNTSPSSDYLSGSR